MTPLSVIHLAPDNVGQMEKFAGYVQYELEEGNVDALKLFLKCRAFKETMELTMEVLKKSAITEAEKYGKGEHEIDYFKFGVIESGGKPSFKDCNDPRLQYLEELIKDRQNYLKSLKTVTPYVDPDTGEEVPDTFLNPIVKKSTTTIKVTIK